MKWDLKRVSCACGSGDPDGFAVVRPISSTVVSAGANNTELLMAASGMKVAVDLGIIADYCNADDDGLCFGVFGLLGYKLDMAILRRRNEVTPRSQGN